MNRLPLLLVTLASLILLLPCGSRAQYNAPPIPLPDTYVTFEDTLLEVEAPGLLGNDFDYEGEALILQTAGGLENGSFTALVTNGRFGYQPDPGFTGVETFTYTMRDASDNEAAPGTVTILVLPGPNRTPIAVSDAYVTFEDTLLEVDAPGLLENDFDYEGEALILQTAGGLENGSFTALVTNGRFGYQPDPGFTGIETFTYTMRDASDNDATPGTVTILVLPDTGGPEPIAVPDAYVTFEDTLLEVDAPGLLGNDFDYEGDELILQTAGGLENGSFTALVTNGRFGYQPDPGFIGTDTFTYTMRDINDNEAAPGTVTIEVLPAPNRAPIALPVTYVTFEGTLLEVDAPGLLGNDFDYEDDELILQTAGGLENGSLTALITNGRFGYQPDPGFIGIETFTYTMRDASDNEAAPGTVTILVLPAEPVPHFGLVSPENESSLTEAPTFEWYPGQYDTFLFFAIFYYDLGAWAGYYPGTFWLHQSTFDTTDPWWNAIGPGVDCSWSVLALNSTTAAFEWSEEWTFSRNEGLER